MVFKMIKSLFKEKALTGPEAMLARPDIRDEMHKWRVTGNGEYISRIYSENPPNGVYAITVKGSYRNGKRDGEWVWYEWPGKIDEKETFLNEKGSFKNGIKEGEWVKYHRNGQLFTKGSYKNGRADGDHIEYYENGQLAGKQSFKDCIQHDDSIAYTKEGRLTVKGRWENGKMEGEWFFANYGGRGVYEKTSGTYKNGVKMLPFFGNASKFKL